MLPGTNSIGTSSESGPILNVLDALAYDIETLEALIEKLRNKIQPVLCPVGPNPGGAELQKVPQPPASDFTLNLQSKRSQIARLQDTVHALLNSIEL